MNPMLADSNLSPTAVPAERWQAPLPENTTREAGPTASPRKWMICCLMGVLGVLAFSVDLPISKVMVEGDWPQPLRRLRGPLHRSLEAIEPFGQPVAVVTVSLAVLLCAGPARGAAFRILATALSSGTLVDLLKISVARVRPRYFNFEGSVADTFHSFFPGAAGSSHIQSWPSGHTATAVGFCLALSTLFPRGRWLFRALAALVAMQRIESGAHYLSDTLFAAAVACGVWVIVFGHGPIGRMFDRIDKHWAAS